MRRKIEEGGHRALYMVSNQEGKEAEDAKVVVAINRRMFRVNADLFQRYFKTNKVKDVEILHLGTRPYDPKTYVVVEDIEALKSFLSRPWRKLTSLSLQGIGMIVRLPDTVYKILTLKVLDLKACPKLMSIPQGIQSLIHLTHLDVSECYFLDHIPKGIESLSELQVLKGFIIKFPVPDSDQCHFNVLSKHKKLIKLDIQARVTSFPTYEDLKTLSEMPKLKKLKVTWVLKIGQDSPKDGRVNNGPNDDSLDDTLPLLPVALEKLDLNAAPEINASRLLDSINYRSGNCLQKLCIRGGKLWKLVPYKHCFLNVKTSSAIFA